jgi:hypothetical protein
MNDPQMAGLKYLNTPKGDFISSMTSRLLWRSSVHVLVTVFKGALSMKGIVPLFAVFKCVSLRRLHLNLAILVRAGMVIKDMLLKSTVAPLKDRMTCWTSNNVGRNATIKLLWI